MTQQLFKQTYCSVHRTIGCLHALSHCSQVSLSDVWDVWCNLLRIKGKSAKAGRSLFAGSLTSTLITRAFSHICSLARPLYHPLPHSLTRSLTQSLTYSLSPLLIHSLNHSIIHPLTCHSFCICTSPASRLLSCVRAAIVQAD